MIVMSQWQALIEGPKHGGDAKPLSTVTAAVSVTDAVLELCYTLRNDHRHQSLLIAVLKQLKSEPVTTF